MSSNDGVFILELSDVCLVQYIQCPSNIGIDAKKKLGHTDPPLVLIANSFRGAKKFSSFKQAMDFAFEMNDGSTEFGIQTIKYPTISFKGFEDILMEYFR